MEVQFVYNQNVDTVVDAEAPGHVFFVGMEPWLGQYGDMDCLQLCSLVPVHANGWIIGQGFDEMI